MTNWTAVELTGIADADELQIASVREDGSLRKPVVIWVVRDGDDVYIRSYKGREASWYRGARARRQGHIHAGPVDKDVTFVDVTDTSTNDRVDAAYRAKYRRYGGAYLNPMLADQAKTTTLKLIPQT